MWFYGALNDLNYSADCLSVLEAINSFFSPFILALHAVYVLVLARRDYCPKLIRKC